MREATPVELLIATPPILLLLLTVPVGVSIKIANLGGTQAEKYLKKRLRDTCDRNLFYGARPSPTDNDNDLRTWHVVYVCVSCFMRLESFLVGLL